MIAGRLSCNSVAADGPLLSSTAAEYGLKWLAGLGATINNAGARTALSVPSGIVLLLTTGIVYSSNRCSGIYILLCLV